MKEIRHLRLDCSTGVDKLVSEHIAGPLTHIVNTVPVLPYTSKFQFDLERTDTFKRVHTNS